MSDDDTYEPDTISGCIADAGPDSCFNQVAILMAAAEAGNPEAREIIMIAAELMARIKAGKAKPFVASTLVRSLELITARISEQSPVPDDLWTRRTVDPEAKPERVVPKHARSTAGHRDGPRRFDPATNTRAKRRGR